MIAPPALHRAIDAELARSGEGWRDASFLYDPPEGGREPSALSYRAGAAAYEVLTGHPPFSAKTRAGLAVQRRLESPRPLGPEVAPALAALVMRALDRDPAVRPTEPEWRKVFPPLAPPPPPRPSFAQDTIILGGPPEPPRPAAPAPAPARPAAAAPSGPKPEPAPATAATPTFDPRDSASVETPTFPPRSAPWSLGLGLAAAFAGTGLAVVLESPWPAVAGALLATAIGLAHQRPSRVAAPSAPSASPAPPPRPSIADDPGQEMVPFLLASYRCFAVLGEGGMGIVYKARHVELGRVCAVKVLLPGRDTEHAIERFRREAQLAARVVHPNCVTVYDFGVASESMFFLAMEFVDGVTLANLIERTPGIPPPCQRVLALTLQIGEAIQAAHDAGITHRDLKPQNVMVTEGGDGREVVKVLDFGLAAPVGASSGKGPAGTPAYMSPEQARNEPDLDARTDVYSLALLVHEALTGQLPFVHPGATPYGVVAQRARLMLTPRPPSAAYPHLGLPPELDDVLIRALKPDRDERTPSVWQFTGELRQAMRRTDANVLDTPPARVD